MESVAIEQQETVDAALHLRAIDVVVLDSSYIERGEIEREEKRRPTAIENERAAEFGRPGNKDAARSVREPLVMGRPAGQITGCARREKTLHCQIHLG